MNAFVKMTYSMDVNSAEFALINRALRGELKEEEKAIAAELAKDMQLQRLKHFDSMVKEMEKLRNNLG